MPTILYVARLLQRLVTLKHDVGATGFQVEKDIMQKVDDLIVKAQGILTSFEGMSPPSFIHDSISSLVEQTKALEKPGGHPIIIGAIADIERIVAEFRQDQEKLITTGESEVGREHIIFKGKEMDLIFSCNASTKSGAS